MNTATKIQPGSKLDKLLKLFMLMRGISDLAPQGGLQMDPKLMAVHDEISERWHNQAMICHMSEREARRFCSNIFDGESE